MLKRRMVGWTPLAVENTAAQQHTPPAPPASESEPVPSVAAQQPAQTPATPAASEHAVPASQPQTAAPQPSGPLQDPDVPRRRMAGWQPLAVANTEAVATAAGPSTAPAEPPTQPAETAVSTDVEAEPTAPTAAEPAVAAAPTGPIQDPDVPRRRMAGWQPLTVGHDAPPVAPAVAPVAAPQPVAPAAAETAPQPAAASGRPAQAATVSSGPVQDPDVPRRRLAGWQPLAVAHPETATPVPAAEPAPAAESTPAAAAEPAGTAEPTAPRRMGAPAGQPQPSQPAAPRRRMGAATEQPQPAPPAGAPPRRMGATPAGPPSQTSQPATPGVVTPEPTTPAATQSGEAAPAKREKKPMSKTTKVILTLLGVAVVAAGLVLVAQWLRTLDPVAQFLATYDGTPTHPDGVEAGIPAWVGWQHFFNFFIIVMVIRSGLLIRNQERPEAYWTPNEGGFFSPKKNTPAKVSIQQWIHQSFNVLWVINGLVFYIMVFATGHWMRIVPTNWDIFPNLVSAGVQYLSLDWPAENAWVYYNALQIMTYFITVFIAAPIAVVTGLRMSTWWPQKAEGLSKALPLPVARKIHFGTMVYFILFIIVHLFLVFTTGVLHNLNMMFTARDATDWWGIAVFAVSVAITVGVAWLIKPIFISPIAERTGTVSTR